MPDTLPAKRAGEAPPPESSELFQAVGGEPGLRAIIDHFVDRLFEDVMIGYLFRAADRSRVKAKEYEFAARQLGAPITYSGRPIPDAHRAHRITGGQFMRRLQILKETLLTFRVPANVSEPWLAHTLSLQSEITNNALDECDPSHTNRARSTPG